MADQIPDASELGTDVVRIVQRSFVEKISAISSLYVLQICDVQCRGSNEKAA